MRVVARLVLLLAAARGLAAQDAPGERARLTLDASRAGPFRAEFEMVVISGDSSQVIGTRSVEVSGALYAEQPAWLIIERRTGAVAAVESLYVSHAMQPLRWSATTGPASLAMVFARDSVFGATSGPGGRQSVLAPVPARLIVSTAFLEALLPVLPLSDHWSDSVNVLLVTQSSTTTGAGELAVIGEDESTGAWIMALRAPAQTLVLWVSRESGRVLRLQQPLALHTASLLEYRAMPSTPP